jgi:membrane fusion protein (multidrug efflux system)
VAEGALLIPQRSLIELQGQYSVMVVDDTNTIASRPIEIGEKVGDMVLVESGLSPGDQVVVDALQKVRSEMKVTPVPSEFESKTTL